MSKEDALTDYPKFSRSSFRGEVDKGDPEDFIHIEHAKLAMDGYAKQEAIGFLYWVDGEGYECTLHTDDNIKLWEEYPDVQLTPNRQERPKPKTTDELYTLYQQSKQK